MLTTIQVDAVGMVRIEGIELQPAEAGEARDPILSCPTYTLEFVRTELLGKAIVALDDQGDPLYVIPVRRPGIYALDEHGHTFVGVKIPAREPALT